MPDVSVTSETTAPIAFNTNTATLAASIQSALMALPSVGAGNVVVTAAAGGLRQWSIEWTGTLGAREMFPLSGTAALTPLPWGGGATMGFSVIDNGSSYPLPGTNAITLLTIVNSVTGGTFTLTVYFALGKRIESRIAQRWIYHIIINDMVMMEFIKPDDVWYNRFPYLEGDGGSPGYDVAILPKYGIVVSHEGNAYYRTIGGSEPYLANHTIRCTLVSGREERISVVTDLLAQRLRELFRHRLSVTTPDGLILSCSPSQQVNSTERLTDRWFVHLGIVLTISVQQNYP